MTGNASAKTILIFGLGYTAGRIGSALSACGWQVISTGSVGSIAFDDTASVHLALDRASHILSSVPPVSDGDPVLMHYGDTMKASAATWIGYLSSTGVYGDAKGAWVDESTPLHGRRAARLQADRDWQAIGAHVFRLPGIYGPGRSALDRVMEGKAHRIDLPEQVFSRIHVDDIVSGVVAAFDAPAAVYNLADDFPCSQNDVIEFACALTGKATPPLQSIETANLSRMAMEFYSENRRVANGKAKRVLGWVPDYPNFRAGLSAIHSPANASTLPQIASPDHR